MGGKHNHGIVRAQALGGHLLQLQHQVFGYRGDEPWVVKIVTDLVDRHFPE
ncbi:MAG: Uncharacterised protein [Cellulomonadaceae bacterium TMED98]|nr:MAG: Uncharacterised protein [Cellulomonadaceae bacterium TMED98]